MIRYVRKTVRNVALQFDEYGVIGTVSTLLFLAVNTVRYSTIKTTRLVQCNNSAISCETVRQERCDM